MGGMLSLVGLGGAADVDEDKGRANGGKDEEEEGEEEKPLRVLNLGDTASIKRVLDDFIVAEVLDRDEIEEDVAWSNVKLVGGFAAIGVALFAQLWPVKFPDNREVLLWCLAAYVVLNVALYMLLVMVEGDNIVFLKNGGPDGKGVAIATRMDRCGAAHCFGRAKWDWLCRCCLPDCGLAHALTSAIYAAPQVRRHIRD